MGDASLRGRSKILKKNYGPHTKTKEQSVEIDKQSVILPKKKPFRIRTLISRMKNYPFEPEVLKQQGELEKAKKEGKEKLRSQRKPIG